jgi:hypothetical protein
MTNKAIGSHIEIIADIAMQMIEKIDTCIVL